MPATALAELRAPSRWSDHDAVVAHIVGAVAGAEVHDEPFSHFYVEGFLPGALYAELLERFPDPRAYNPVNLKRWVRANGESTRDRLFLEPAAYARMTAEQAAFWAGLEAVLRSEEVKRATFRALERDLALRCALPEGQVEDMPAEATPVLIRDTEDYELKPHPDGLPRLVTTQIYLPGDLAQEALGTSLYAERPLWRRLLGGRFREVKRFPFRPNSAYSFVVLHLPDRKSWHGRALVTAADGVRHSILNTYHPPGFGLPRKNG